MNEGNAWTMEWTKDTYATCCVKMLKITRFSDQHVSLSCYEYCIYEIQFNLKYFSCLIENSNLACRTLSRSTKFCKELHGFVLVAFLMTSWQWRYHNVVLAPFLNVIAADFNNTILLWFIEEITHILHILYYLACMMERLGRIVTHSPFIPHCLGLRIVLHIKELFFCSGQYDTKQQK